jgi:hypothetical protein
MIERREQRNAVTNHIPHPRKACCASEAPFDRDFPANAGKNPLAGQENRLRSVPETPTSLFQRPLRIPCADWSLLRSSHKACRASQWLA